MEIKDLKTRLTIFSLWLFVLLNIIFRDIHQLTLKSHLEMLLTGYFNGMEVTESIMLFGAVIVNIPISMLLVSMLLNRRQNKILNIVAAVLLGASFLLSPPTDMDDTFHLVVELLALLGVVRACLMWKQTNAVSKIV